jgi:hypothetical protein
MTGKMVGERKLGSNCVCQSKCMDAIGEEECAKIFSSFWALGDHSVLNAYPAGLTDVSEVKGRTKSGGEHSHRGATMKYKVSVNGSDKKVCKHAFLSLHGISNGRFIRILEKKHLGGPGTDMRGQHSNCSCENSDFVKAHINSTPKQPSHYSRVKIPNKRCLSPELNIVKLHQMYKEKCVKKNMEPVSEYRYRYIFNHGFNFSFGRPFQDTCKECDRLDMHIKSTGGEEGKNLKLELNLHQREAEAAYEALKQDGARSKQDPSTVVVCFDLQQALPTPIIHTSVVFL